MGFIKLTCPNCGATIQLSADREFGFCAYCGTKIIQDKIIVEHRGKVSIDGVANVQSLMERVQIFIEEHNWSRAITYCEKVLDIDPRNIDAYIARLQAQTKTTEFSKLSMLVKPLEKYDSYRNAIRFASPDLKSKLILANNQTIQNCNEQRKKKEADLETINKEYSQVAKKTQSALFWSSKATLFRVSLIFLLLLVVYYCEGNGFYVILSLAAVIIGFVFLNKKKKDLLSLKVQFENITDTVDKAYNEYNEWNTWVNTYEQ